MDTMSHWLELMLWGSADVLLLTLAAAANLALRTSLARLAGEMEGSAHEERLSRLYASRQQFLQATGLLRIGAILVLVLIVLAFLEETQFGSDRTRSAWAFLVTILLCAVFALAIPAGIERYAGETLILRCAPVLQAVRIVLFPLLWVLGMFDPLVRRLAGVSDEESSQTVDVEREILGVVSEGERQGAVSQDEREMIESVIELRNLHVNEIMTPRTDIVAVPVDATLEDVRRTIREHGHSRIPVYEETIDRVVGVLYAKDLLQIDDAPNFDLRAGLRTPLFVPETKRVRDLLHEFQQQKIHLAVVLDEYGGTAGLVTIEDIIEELVGDISDEHEQPEARPVVQIDPRTYDVDARMSIEEVNEELRINIPESEYYETIGGFISSSLGRIPGVGDLCRHDGIAFEVVDGDARKVSRLRIRLPDELGQEAEEVRA
ncbi:MAG: membrane protein [Planctomycetota bacterium]|nr:MAG: membrane protein [Planctomycetota bacterium]